MLEKKEKKTIDELNKYLVEKKYVVISDPSKSIFILSNNDKKMNMFIVLFHGNYGKKDVDRVYEMINKGNDNYYIVDTSIKCNNSSCQYIEEIPEYIMSNFKLVKEFGYYKIYYKE